MSKCPNCGTAMSCGCQRRVLPNGKAGCSKCLGKYPSANQTGEAPTINNAEIEDKL
jgi:hypothetical protein